MKQYDIFGKAASPVDTEEKYTKKVPTPVYEIKGEKPHIMELMDRSKTIRIQRRIEAVKDLDPLLRKFLMEAATRHTIFNYDKIAEYYAHAPKEVQYLIEDSALVIIDFDKAIQLGYVKLSEETMQHYLEDKKS